MGEQASLEAKLELLRDAAAMAGLDLYDALTTESAASDFCAKLKVKCSTGVNHPVNGQAFRTLQGRLPEIAAALMDAETRAELSRCYGAEVAEARSTQQERLTAVLVHLKDAGRDFDEHTRASILKEFVSAPGSLLSEAEVDATATKVGLSKRSVAPRSEVSLFLAADMERLAASLKLLAEYEKNSSARYTTLYEFLGVGVNSSEQEIKSSIATLERFWATKANGQTKTAAQEALSRSKIWLVGAERRKYDLTLMYVVLGDTGLWSLLAVAGAGGVLDTAEFSEIRKQAIDAGATPDDAEALIEYEAGRRKLRIAGTPPPAPPVKRCGYCGRTSALDAKVCTNTACGRPFDLQCIECGTSYKSFDGICPKCGLTLGAQIQIEEAQARVSSALSRGDLDSARDTAVLISGSHPKSKVARALEQTVKNAVAALDKELGEVASLVAQRRLVEAAKLLEGSGSKRRLPPERQAELASIKTDIERAEKLVVDHPAASDAEMFKNLEAAYAICVDSPRIRSVAAGYRPDPPKMISTDQRDGTVSLKWAASPSTGVNSYRVYRKSNSAPVGTADAQELACVGSARFEDSKAPVGERLYYAVVAERLGIPSALLVSSPVIVTAQVVGARVMAGDGWVRVKWTLPNGATGVVVERKEVGSSAPSIPIAATKDGFSDSHVVNGTQYCYQVYAEFSASDGARRSTPLSIDAIPKAPPKPPTAASATVEGMRVKITYSAGSDSQVVIVRTREKPVFSEGQLVSIDDLEAAGRLIRSASPDRASDDLEAGGVYYYTLASVDVPQAAVGPTVRVVALQDCSGLKVSVQESDVTARWSWPAEATVTMLTAALGKPVTSFEEPATVCRKIEKSEYERAGGVSFGIPTPGDYHVRLFAGYQTEGGLSYAPGSGAGSTAVVHVGAKDVLTYSLLRGMLGRYQLRLEGPRGMRVPDCMVISKPGFVPIGPTDGAVLITVPSFVLDSVRLIARIRGIEPQEIARITADNTKRIYNIR